ncbi:MAG: hypothetical protein A2452_01570 [Candidatus Firestonebacteria bacterium RIFOXYC2_FULL_39_67]|nr:MAG: hypothetical protein A2536_05765 [Candidatus Firestonebacteria bacterium RIFOXYD2_FULL_39_29]OGF54201.1 MAG: hypothetical protein A2452_01570 [Candidatus Firestonebacteria bacterium RIFOXYC2_FULL_39_67]OGF57673.1 MAG: hypothetical protein A2497_03490 [Candidatus Firestonebacteria bacterium RifOxyC12_full_39_7]
MIKRGEYQGKPVISLMKMENDKFPFTFGLNKAKLILANLSEIQKFVEEAESGTPAVNKDNPGEKLPF